MDDAVWPFGRQHRMVGRLVAALDMIDAPIDDRSVESAVPVLEAYQ